MIALLNAIATNTSACLWSLIAREDINTEIAHVCLLPMGWESHPSAIFLLIKYPGMCHEVNELLRKEQMYESMIEGVIETK